MPPFLPHQEIDARSDEMLGCALVRSDQQAVVINLDTEAAQKPEKVVWIDPVHRVASGPCHTQHGRMCMARSPR